MSGPGHLCSVAGIQGMLKTPLLLVPCTYKQMEQAPSWGDEGPQMLPHQGKEAECQECERQHNKCALSFYPAACGLFVSYKYCLLSVTTILWLFLVLMQKTKYTIF
ncbi:hypothetical protein CRENBAI_017524 [Crenichthys baileyi]|uniref:Uncharacterized protein n=1 Tax=Crenichthys baileyi TaxID=28760 RepID=A0AAV9QX27_9TELE